MTASNIVQRFLLSRAMPVVPPICDYYSKSSPRFTPLRCLKATRVAVVESPDDDTKLAKGVLARKCQKIKKKMLAGFGSHMGFDDGTYQTRIRN